jgi:hypothetical protein
MGIMIEIKTPYRRAVDGNIPFEYLLQMQGQMAACGFLECEFVDCKIDVLQNEAIYIESTKTNGKTDHGIIIEHRDTIGNPTFEYSPEYLTSEECIQWKNNYTKPYTKITYWKLYKLLPTRVYFDEKLWQDLVPQIESFWNEVILLRTQGKPISIQSLKTTDKNSKKQKFDFIDSDEE